MMPRAGRSEPPPVFRAARLLKSRLIFATPFLFHSNDYAAAIIDTAFII